MSAPSPSAPEIAVELLDGLASPIAVASQSGALAYANRAFEQTFGPGGADWIRSAARSVAGEHGWLLSFFASTRADDTSEVEYEGRTYRVKRIPMARESGSVALSFDDVTHEREVEQAKSDFTSMIVHDLRGPLSGIQGTLDFVTSQDQKLDQLQEELLREASREAERMMSLINDLLDFSKIESGNFTIDEDTVRVGPMIHRAVVSLQSVATRDGIHLFASRGADLPQLNGSVDKLTQAIINLISNSLKFTPKEGVISVTAQPVRDDGGPHTVLITVTDSGIGIRPEDQPKIFEKYKQSGNKSLRGGAGTGLGLYIVRQIVEAHGGTISLASSYGVGTSMVIALPVRREAA